MAAVLFVEEVTGRWDSIRALQPRIEDLRPGEPRDPLCNECKPAALLRPGLRRARRADEAQPARACRGGARNGGIRALPRPLTRTSRLDSRRPRTTRGLLGKMDLWHWATHGHLVGVTTRLDTLVALERVDEVEESAPRLLQPRNLRRAVRPACPGTRARRPRTRRPGDRALRGDRTRLARRTDACCRVVPELVRHRSARRESIASTRSRLRPQIVERGLDPRLRLVLVRGLRGLALRSARATNVEVIAAMMIVRKAMPSSITNAPTIRPEVCGGHVSVAHRGHGLQGPPHAYPDVRVLILVEQPHRDTAADDHDRRRRNDDAGGSPNGRRLRRKRDMRRSIRFGCATRGMRSTLIPVRARGTKRSSGKRAAVDHALELPAFRPGDGSRRGEGHAE